MLKITVELVPHGDESQATVIALCHIANDGTHPQTPRRGNYHADIRGGGYEQTVRVTDFPRLDLGAWHLLHRILDQCAADARLAASPPASSTKGTATGNDCPDGLNDQQRGIQRAEEGRA